VIEWVVITVWALRINRIGVMLTAQLAMTRAIVIAIIGPMGLYLDRGDWVWILLGICVFGMAAWPWMHEQSLRRGWTLGPGGRIPQPRNNWYWRYWPYS
jgi:hypothetical protein